MGMTKEAKQERTARVGPKGQVVVPKQIRDELGIQPGDRVTVYRLGDVAHIRRVRSIDELRGIFRDAPGDPFAELAAERRRERERDERRIGKVAP